MQKIQLKLLEKSTGEHLQNAEQGKDASYLTPKARSIKRKTDKLDFIETKNFCSRKTMLRG